jgi:hypothetical protein
MFKRSRKIKFFAKKIPTIFTGMKSPYLDLQKNNGIIIDKGRKSFLNKKPRK